MQKAVYLHSPGTISLAHLVCKHLKLKPHYKDVYLRHRRPIQASPAELSLLQEEGKPEDKTDGSTESGKEDFEKKAEAQGRLASSDSSTYAEYHLETVSTYLPKPIAEYIIERFCEELGVETYNKIDFDTTCPECLRVGKREVKRKHLERELIAKMEPEESSQWFAISTEWIMKWRLYLYHEGEEDRLMRTYFFDSYEEPPKVDSSSLFDAETPGILRADINEAEDIFLVNPKVMEVLTKLYGCDIFIGREGKKLSGEEVEYKPSYVSLVD